MIISFPDGHFGLNKQPPTFQINDWYPNRAYESQEKGIFFLVPNK